MQAMPTVDNLHRQILPRQENQLHVNVRTPTNCCAFIDNLFGPRTHAVPVFGAPVAIDELTRAVTQDGLFIQPQAVPTPLYAIQVAYQHLQRASVFPGTNQMRDFHNLSLQDRLELGINTEGYCRIPTVTTGITPPFVNLRLAETLDMLKLIAKYYNQYRIHVLHSPQKYAYQLGVITMTTASGPVVGKPSFRALLFPTAEQGHITGTLWLYRWCHDNGVGGYTEEWRGLGDASFDMATLAEVAPVSMPQSTMPNTKKRKRSMVEKAETLLNHDQPASQVKEVEERALKKARKSGTASEVVADDTLFEQDPESVRGPAILTLAQRYSNTELFERINAGLAAKGLALIKDSNVVTRRITLAIESQAKNNRDVTAKELRDELNTVRKLNGVRARMNVRSQETKYKKFADLPPQTGLEALGDEDGEPGGYRMVEFGGFGFDAPGTGVGGVPDVFGQAATVEHEYTEAAKEECNRFI